MEKFSYFSVFGLNLESWAACLILYSLKFDIQCLVCAEEIKIILNYLKNKVKNRRNIVGSSLVMGWSSANLSSFLMNLCDADRYNSGKLVCHTELVLIELSFLKNLFQNFSHILLIFSKLFMKPAHYLIISSLVISTASAAVLA